MSLRKRTLEQNMPWLLVIGGGVGLLAAFILTLEKLALLKDPAHQLSCSLNPILSCGPIILSDQASAFGFPNPIIGLIGFSVVITIGMAMFAGAKFKSWFWKGLSLGTIFGIVFVHWLIYQSIYTLNALCLYCLAVWAITWPVFWYTTLYNLKSGHLKAPKSLNGLVGFAQKNHANILISWYIVIIGLILHHFWYYWSTLI